MPIFSGISVRSFPSKFKTVNSESSPIASSIDFIEFEVRYILSIFDKYLISFGIRIIKGSELSLSISNTGDHELYAIILGIDADSNIFALYSPNETKTADSKDQLQNVVIASQTELVIPQVENSWKWKVPDSVGINTLYVVLTLNPWHQTLLALATQQNIKSNQQQILNVVNPHLVLEKVMEDLHSISSVDHELLPKEDVYALDVHNWATLSFVYEIANA